MSQVSIVTPLIPEAERTALQDMLQSEGWHLFKDMVLRLYGPEAFEQAIADVLQGTKPADLIDTERAIVPQIQAAFKAARGVLELPKRRMDTLKEAPKPKTLLDPRTLFRQKVAESQAR